MRIFGAAILAASLLVSNAFAETTLPAGKPAGVKKAQGNNPSTLMIVGAIGIAGLGIGLASSSNGGGPTTVTTATVATAP